MSRNPRIAKIKAIIASRMLNEANRDEPIDPFQEMDDDSSESYIGNTDSDDSSEERSRSKKEKSLSLLSTRHVSRLVTSGNLRSASLDPDYDKENFNISETPANRLAENLHDTSVSFDRLFSGGPDFPNSPMVIPPTDCSEISLPIIDLPAHDDSGEIPFSQLSQRTAHNNSHFIPGIPAPGNRSAHNLQDTSVKFDHVYTGGPDSSNSSMVAPANCSEISPSIINLPAHDDSGEIPCSQFSQERAHNNSH
ncbi:jg19218, partial [Pararge aegeria aegeria]